MDSVRRKQLAEKLLDGYVSGPTATTEATARARQKADVARAVVIVEGISDQIALEALAIRLRRSLDEEGVVIFPVGGAHAATRYLREFGPQGDGKRVAGLYDVGEEAAIRWAVAQAGIGDPRTRPDLARLGFHVCVDDLEDELIRAVGPEHVEALIESQGDLSSFRSLQRQPAWRDRDLTSQVRRFLGAGSRRKLRYARLFVESVDLDRVPRPLNAVLAEV